VFSFIQELAAKELGADLGVYHHFAGSLRIFEQHYALAQEIIRHNHDSNLDIFVMPEIPDSSSGLAAFIETE
jgi:thymidylate synthase